MSDPPRPPPQQQQRPPPTQQRPAQKEQTPQQQQQKARDRSAHAPARETPASEAETARQQGIKVEEEARVEGTGGARNLAYEWIDVWLPGGKPMYIVVKTLPDHDLAVTIEQRTWKKSYGAKGRVQTDVVPIAPIGTTGKLVAKDVSTGEELTVSFRWGPLAGPSLFAWLVKLAKRLFTNAK